MKEIKFRQPIFHNGKFVEWHFWGYIGNNLGFFTSPLSSNDGEIKPSQQFVNLRDKDEEEIFEGDILEMDSWNPSNVQVKFIEGAFCLADKNGDYVGDIHYIEHAEIKQAKIIGNILNDKELL